MKYAYIENDKIYITDTPEALPLTIPHVTLPDDAEPYMYKIQNNKIIRKSDKEIQEYIETVNLREEATKALHYLISTDFKMTYDYIQNELTKEEYDELVVKRRQARDIVRKYIDMYKEVW